MHLAVSQSIWRHWVVHQFAKRFICIVVDHRGLGSSSPSWAPMTTPSMARAVVDVLHHAGGVGTHVFGLSLGDMVAHELAIQHPDKIRTLVLAATTAGGSNPDFRVGSLVVGC